MSNKMAQKNKQITLPNPQSKPATIAQHQQQQIKPFNNSIRNSAQQQMMNELNHADSQNVGNAQHMMTSAEDRASRKSKFLNQKMQQNPVGNLSQSQNKHKMNMSMNFRQMNDNEVKLSNAKHQVGNSRNNHTRMPSLP